MDARKAIEETANLKVTEAKRKNSTYGEAVKYLHDLGWKASRDEIDNLVLKEATAKLRQEMGEIKIKK
ncbi:hypothetical protein J416_09349 [Gracilibacillus halophilus YIM-C55.5]|uniref:Uncharacterized protein n=1 Tax=Gracilibacillus halophilus YIM-C55.5 TaxID=1308866 RepID=N4WKK6_9BACI|nr:hypothetical protein [Gracilibacillus halophilus]ENH96692.1 hypothetical protein J416_09349 [Gracilibacillus halophilus YIM-C55.5]